MHWILRFASRARMVAAYVIVGSIAGAVSYGFGQSKNFSVFSAAARAIVRGEDLYVLRAPDYFKYSPTFALLFVPFTWPPAWIASVAWSALNFAVACVGIDRVVEDVRAKRVAMLVALAGIALSTDGDQSNLLVAGAWLLAYDAFERSRAGAGAAWTMMGGFVKIFPALGAVFALFHPHRSRALTLLVIAALAWLALPLLVCTPHELANEYRSWAHLLAWDRRNSGWSVLPVLQDVARIRWANVSLQIAGAIAQSIPIVLGLRFGTDAAWRRTLACSLMVFAVLFNHRTEYCSFALSAVAVGVWCATVRASKLVTALVAMAIVAPGPFLARPDPSVTGVFAFIAAHREFHPLRIVPLFLIWLLMQHELWRRFVRVELAVPKLREEH